jgi:hypothetical protein
MNEEPTMAAWDQVRSREAAEALRLQGVLEPVLLVPAELGGEVSAANVVLLPPEARRAKDATTAELLDVFRGGRADQLSVTPDYRGDSLVPAGLMVTAWREGSAPAYERRIGVW